MTIARPAGVEFVAEARRSQWSAADEISRVTDVRALGPYWMVEFACSEALAAGRPGQFVMIRPLAQRNMVRRPFTIYGSDRDRNRAQIVFRVTGPGTSALASLEPADRVSVLGPLGNGFRLALASKRAIVIGRGVGMASLHGLATSALQRGLAVTVLNSARDDGQWLDPDSLHQGGAEVMTVDDASGSSGVGPVEARLDRHFAAGGAAAFVCGSSRLIELAAQLGHRHGASVQAAVEAPMACGIGTCHACPVDTLGAIEGPLVCVDGPIFEARVRLAEAVIA